MQVTCSIWLFEKLGQCQGWVREGSRNVVISSGDGLNWIYGGVQGSPELGNRWVRGVKTLMINEEIKSRCLNGIKQHHGWIQPNLSFSLFRQKTIVGHTFSDYISGLLTINHKRLQEITILTWSLVLRMKNRLK